MKGLESLIRLQKWHVDEKRRHVGELEGLLADLNGRVAALEEEIRREQDVAANGMVTFIYGSYAEAAIGRRETLEKSIFEVLASIEVARDELSELFQELKRFEIARDHELDEREYKANKREQSELDDMGLERYRRSSAAR